MFGPSAFGFIGQFRFQSGVSSLGAARGLCCGCRVAHEGPRRGLDELSWTAVLLVEEPDQFGVECAGLCVTLGKSSAAGFLSWAVLGCCMVVK